MKSGLIKQTFQIENKCCIWTLKNISNDEILLGSSSGKVFIINTSQNENLTQKLECSQGEVLCCETTIDNKFFFISGNDSNIFMITKDQNSNKYVVVNKLRGQSHSVFALFCIYDGSFSSGKLLSGGETSDICVMDFSSLGFTNFGKTKKEANGSVKLAGFRHVLEPLNRKLYKCSSNDSFIRADNGFYEVVQITKDKLNSFKSIFSLEHKKAITFVDYCDNTNLFAYYNKEDNEMVVVHTLNGNKIFIKENLQISKLFFCKNHLCYFDISEQKIVFLKKFQKFVVDNELEINLQPVNKNKILFFDNFQTDFYERFLLMNDNLSRTVFLYNFQTKQIENISQIWTKNPVIKILNLHPIKSEIFYLDNSNQLFYYSIKNKTTHKVNLNQNKIPHNLQIYNIEFDMFNFENLMLISDYHVVKIKLDQNSLKIKKRNNRIINLISIINKNSKIIIFELNNRMVKRFLISKSYNQ